MFRREPPCGETDRLKELRERVKHFAVRHKMLELVTRGWKKGETAPLPPDVTEQLRLLTAEWLQEQGLTCNTQVAPGQPLALDLLRGLMQVGI